MATFYIFLLYCFVVSYCDVDVYTSKYQLCNNTRRVVGGHPVSIQEFPYVAYLEIQNGDSVIPCGGTIISKRYILSAAHCLFGQLQVLVKVGSTSKNGGTKILSKSLKCHPKYDHRGYDYDIAYIELSRDIDIDGVNTDIIQLAEAGSTIEPGTNIIVSGWGRTSEGGQNSETLMAIEVPSVHVDQCIEIYGSDISERMFCAGLPQGGKDACQGDSGGPAVNDDRIQIGVVSFGMGCARPNIPGVYAKVAAFRDWIKEGTGV